MKPRTMRNRPMKTRTWAAALVALALPATLAAPMILAQEPVMAPHRAATSGEPVALDLVERGKYIVSTSGCHDCHTPFMMGPNGPEPDMSRALSGHPQDLLMPTPPVLPAGPWQIVVSGTATAHAGPWGVTYTANLTPDAETGLGKWTMQQFVDTIRTGRRLGRGREILPPMPIPVYRNLTDADLEAVFAYLQSIPAISNKVPDPIVAEEVLELEAPGETAEK